LKRTAIKQAYVNTLCFKSIDLSPEEFNFAVASVEKSFGSTSRQALAAKNMQMTYMWQRQQYVSALTIKQQVRQLDNLHH
jgi:hypothetical protein